MPMSEEHKAALAQGRREARVIKAYLKALADKKPGRPVTKESLTNRLDTVERKIDEADNPLETVDLIQTKLDLEQALADLENAEDIETLEAGFVENAASYSDRKGVSYTAWREYGVPAKVLRAAGIKETRRR